MPHGKWESITVRRERKQRLRDTYPKAPSDDMRMNKMLDQNQSYRRWLKSLRDRRGSGMVIVGVIMSLTVLALISIMWITMHELQWDYVPWFAVITFLIMIFMVAYIYSKVDRPVREGYYE